MKGLIGEYSPKAPLLVTEFNIGMSDPLTAWKYNVSLAQAAYLSQMLALFSTAGVDGAYHCSLIGNHCFGQIISGDDPRLRPSAMLYRILDELDDAKAVDTGVDADVMKYKAIGNVVPSLSPNVVFAQGYSKGNSLTVLVVNRKPDSPVQVTFRKSDGSPMSLTGGRQLIGDDPFAQVDKTPKAVWMADVPAGPTLNLLPCGVALVRLK